MNVWVTSKVGQRKGQAMTVRATKPAFAMQVADVATSIAFYTNYIECTLAEQQPGPDMALLIFPDSDTCLLLGPHAGDPTPYLAEEHYIIKFGESETFRLEGGDLDARRSTLLQKGLKDLQLVEKRWGDRSLNIKDPDGYILSFYTPAQRSPQETLTLYIKGPDELEAALSGLSEADLDLAGTQGEWSIRAIVHHLAEGELIFVSPLKTAAAESGRIYYPNWHSGNLVVAENLNYAGRPIEPSLALFRVVHSYVVQLAQYVPDVWEHYVQYSHGPRVSFGAIINDAMAHTLEHIDEILEIRRIHGV
jgi:catechol 2,3-dioxygenase-like lactoylglutathione lyase family enzyme